MPILEVKDIHKKFDKSEVLKGISFALDKGEVLGIIGSSGGGKTTLLHMLAGLLSPSEGKVFADETDLYSLKDQELSVLRNRKTGV